MEDLPEDLSDEDIVNIFDAYCSGCKCEVLEPIDGPLIATVVVPTYSEAEWIVSNLNGNIPQGLNGPIRASTPQYSMSTPKRIPPSYGKAQASNSHHQSPYSKPGDQGAERSDPNNTNLYVNQLPQGCDDERLNELFQECGNIVSVKCISEKRYGFVQFASVEQAENAIDMMNGLEVEGTPLVCRFAAKSRT